MKVYSQFFRRRSRLESRRSKRGQTLVEYALITAVLSVIGVAVYGLMNGEITAIFSSMSRILDTAQGS